MVAVFCENCGKEISATADFCDNCGHRVVANKGSKGSLAAMHFKSLVSKVKSIDLSGVKNVSPIQVLLGLLVILALFCAYYFYQSYQTTQQTIQQLQSVASSTSQKLTDQEQELNQKVSQIAALQAAKNTSNTSSGVSSSNVLATLAPSVVNVFCGADGTTGDIDEGSGVLYHSASSSFGPYYVMTNLHVVQTSDGSPTQCAIILYPDYTDTSNYLVYGASGYNTYETGVDLAYLTPTVVDDDNAGTIDQLARYAKEVTPDTYCSSSAIGDHLSILGYPGIGGSSLTATDGIISGYEYDDGVRFIKTSAEIEHGNSGGVAIEDSGCILGIPTFVDRGEISSIGRILDLNDLFSATQ